MALTQITTTGIADDAITADKLPTNLDLIDNQKIRFGTSNDFEVYHDGTRSWVRDSGSGNLIIDTDGSEIDINSGGNAEYMARFIKDGSVELYYDNSKKIETKSYGVNMPDNSQLYFGTGDDLVIKHDGSNSYIVNATGALHIRNDGIYFKNSGGSESFIDCSPNAEVSLFYDNSKKIETTSWGVDVTGTLRADDISLQDSHILKIGSDNDLQLTHSGNDSTISKTTAGNLLIYVEEDFYLKHGTEVMIAAKDDGAVELFYNGSKKFETYAGGCQMGGDLSFYDSQVANFGTGSDLQIYHNGTDSYLINTTGSFIFRNDGEFKWQKNNGSFVGYIDPDGETRVYHNASQKIVTTSSGCTVYGTVNETSDIALKENIKPLSNSLANLKQLNGYSYKFKDTEKVTGVKSLGLTAQEVEKVYPELVEGEEGQKTLQYSGLIAPLLEAIKELNTKIETLETKVAALEAK